MLSKCANPACFARFRYLNEGKIFNVEMGAAISGAARLSCRIEHFWLCASCARVLKVVRESGEVAVRPLHLALPDGDAEGRRESDAA